MARSILHPVWGASRPTLLSALILAGSVGFVGVLLSSPALSQRILGDGDSETSVSVSPTDTEISRSASGQLDIDLGDDGPSVDGDGTLGVSIGDIDPEIGAAISIGGQDDAASAGPGTTVPSADPGQNSATAPGTIETGCDEDLAHLDAMLSGWKQGDMAQPASIYLVPVALCGRDHATLERARRVELASVRENLSQNSDIAAHLDAQGVLPDTVLAAQRFDDGRLSIYLAASVNDSP
ncbi:hypothetical protein [Pelagibacterium montanilacus]|uniref:hypothetical protein n=1 Tax=Pelagibacterium montanilacus TaxID=2185280 RepID=UPI000F8EC688|nr:hypothetical protein [Pelagibacterium montanilacus]